MGIALLLLVSFAFVSIINVKRIEAQNNKTNEIKTRARNFYNRYTSLKELNVVKNVCTYNFDEVIDSFKLCTEIKLHINTVRGVPVDYILEVVDPTVLAIFKKDGLPTCTYALDKMELSEYYVSSKLSEFNLSRFSSAHRATLSAFISNRYGSSINKAAIFAVRKLCIIHLRELSLQMVDEHDYKYWLKNSYMG